MNENLIKIEKIQYWKVEEAIKNNRHLNICGNLNYFADIKHSCYYSNELGTIVKWLYVDKTGYYTKKELLIFC